MARSTRLVILIYLSVHPDGRTDIQTDIWISAFIQTTVRTDIEIDSASAPDQEYIYQIDSASDRDQEYIYVELCSDSIRAK